MTTEYENTPVLNPSDHNWTRNLYRMCAGAYGDARCYVWANSFEDAFEQLVEWLDDEKPGLLTRIDYDAAAREHGFADFQAVLDTNEEPTIELVREMAESDMTVIGHTTLNNGNAIPSWEWGGDELAGETFDAVKALCVAADEEEEV